MNTALALLESTMIPSVDLSMKNSMDYNRLAQISEAANQRLGFIAEKVIVVENPDERGTYMMEFSGNLERLMKDQVIDLNEAVNAVAEANNISVCDCVVVFDESAKNKIDIGEVISSNADFSIARL